MPASGEVIIGMNGRYVVICSVIFFFQIWVVIAIISSLNFDSSRKAKISARIFILHRREMIKAVIHQDFNV